jgi:hypothetical protein
MAYMWIIRHESIEVNPEPYYLDEDKKNKGSELDAKNRMKKAPKDRVKT